MNEARFHTVWVPLQERFFRVACHLLEDRAEAEDTVQDLYIKLWGMRDMLEMVKNPAAYGILLTRNLCIDKIRKRRPLQEADDSLPGEPPPDSSLIQKELLREALEAIENLPPGQRTVLRMRVFQGKTNGEIAKETGMSELSVRVQMSLARTKIKKQVQR